MFGSISFVRQYRYIVCFTVYLFLQYFIHFTVFHSRLEGISCQQLSLPPPPHLLILDKNRVKKKITGGLKTFSDRTNWITFIESLVCGDWPLYDKFSNYVCFLSWRFSEEWHRCLPGPVGEVSFYFILLFVKFSPTFMLKRRCHDIFRLLFFTLINSSVPMIKRRK